MSVWLWDGLTGERLLDLATGSQEDGTLAVQISQTVTSYWRRDKRPLESGHFSPADPELRTAAYRQSWWNHWGWNH